MIGPGIGPEPNLLRQYELGAVPEAIAHEEDATRGQDEERAKKRRKGSRRRWLRFLRRH